MSMTLTSDQQCVVRQLAASGQYTGEGQVLDEALELLRQRDDLRARLRVGIDQLDRGERLPIAEVILGSPDEVLSHNTQHRREPRFSKSQLDELNLSEFA